MTFQNMIKILVVSTVGLAATVSFADVRLKFAEGTQGLLWRDQFNAFYQVCPAVAPVSRDCKPILGPLRYSLDRYITELQKGFGVSGSGYLGTGGMERLAIDIREAEAALADATLSAEERERLELHMLSLKKAELNLLQVNSITGNMDLGKDITYNESYSDLFPKITDPFKALGSSNNFPEKVTRFPETGLILTELDNMCWYDAAGRKRVEGPCQSDVVQKGCVLSYGPQWRLPAMSDSEFLYKHFRGTLQRWNGDRGIIKRDYNTSAYIFSWASSSYGDLRKDNAITMCLARAIDVEPNGDIDGDAIPNIMDRCNYQAEDLTAPVAQSGSSIGCAAGQKPDSAGQIDTTPGNLTTDVSATLTRGGDGKLVIWVQSNKAIRAVSIVTNSGLFAMTQNDGSNEFASQFWANASGPWLEKTVIPLQVTFGNGSVQKGEISLRKNL